MAGESAVIAAIAIGGGKSMIFMLPASCGHGGVSVVVLPLIALRQDMRRRCESIGRQARDNKLVKESSVTGAFPREGSCRDLCLQSYAWPGR